MSRRSALATAFTAVFAVGILAGSPEATASNTVRFDLSNHPDGSAAPPFYGLRLDDPDTSDTETFNFNGPGGTGASTVSGELDLDTGLLTVSGEAEHNQTGNIYGIMASIQLDDIGTLDVNELFNPSMGVSDLLTGNTLSLSLFDVGNGPYSGPSNWEGFMDPSFTLGVNHRLDNTDSEYPALTGEGWLAPAGKPWDHVDYQDWLFILENPVVPVPPAAGLIAVGIVGVGLRRRMQSASN